MSHSRVIIHVDLDAFYCQVEQKRLGIDRSLPLAVQQWDSLIAVSYESRKFGVTRHDRVDEALKKCPELRLVHVDTYGEHGLEQDNALMASVPVDSVETGGSAVAPAPPPPRRTVSKSTNKVCLERYRKASFEIFKVFQRHTDKCQRASIDEAYLDVTSQVDKLLATEGLGTPAYEGQPLNDTPIALHDPNDVRLCAGSKIAARLRAQVWEECGYTCSAGISHNKMLAKLASAMYKPNKQTLVPQSSVLPFLSALPLKKVRHLGGKFGDQIEAMGYHTCGDLMKLTENEMLQNFGEKSGLWLYRVCRGIDEELVVERSKPKSMLAAKSIPETSTQSQLSHWLQILARELVDRIQSDWETHNRIPMSMSVHYRAVGAATEKSKQCSMPSLIRERMEESDTETKIETIVKSCMSLLSQCKDVLPCNRLAIGADKFEDCDSGKFQTIDKMFASAAASASKPAPSGGDQSPPPPPPAPIAKVEKKKPTIRDMFLSGAQAPTNSEQSPPPLQPPKTASKEKRPIVSMFATLAKGRPSSASPPKEPSDERALDGGGCQDNSSGHMSSSDDGGEDSPTTELDQVATTSTPAEVIEILTEQQTFLCQKCGTVVAVSDRQEHSDFHVAQELQSELRKQDREAAMQRVPPPPQSHPANKKKRTQAQPNSADKRQKSVLSFFGEKRKD